MLSFSQVILLAFITFLPLNLFSQQVNWADSVIEYSSQKSPKAFAAIQVLGKPNRYPNPAFSTCAWSPEYSEERKLEYLSVGFKSPIVAKQLLIVENNNSGHILEIWISGNGKSRKIYQRTNPPSGGGGRLFIASLKDNVDLITGIKIIFDQPERLNTYQIDAIGLSESTEPVSLTINTAPTSSDFKAVSLGPVINTPYDEVCPIISPDGKSLYFDRKQHPNNIGAAKNDDIWLSELVGSSWSTPVNIGAPLNNEDHNFMCSLSPDGNTALVGNIYGSEQSGVSLSYRSAAGWSSPVAVKIDNFNNQNQYNEFTLSTDGSVMVMSLETPEGNGLLDLYVSFLKADKSYTTPRSIGNQINTAGNEMTPFLAADGKTLYFSSNGFPGYGNQDIFMAKRLDNSWTNWTEPMNLGSEVNTPEWDVYYSIDAKGEYAYFSSSKTTGTNLDLFRIQLPPEAQPNNVMWLKGRVSDRSSDSTISAQLTIVSLDNPEIANSLNSSIEKGYNTILQQLGNYQITINADGYYAADTIVAIQLLTDYNEVVKDFSLVPMKEGVIITMKNILFKVNSSILEDTSFAEIDKVVKFMVDNPKIELEIRGHTNGVCDDDYCNSLSTKRAKAVVDYCIARGIEPTRLTWKGLGKTEPIADNKTAAGRQANQRVEFMVTKVK